MEEDRFLHPLVVEEALRPLFDDANFAVIESRDDSAHSCLNFGVVVIGSAGFGVERVFDEFLCFRHQIPL